MHSVIMPCAGTLAVVMVSVSELTVVLFSVIMRCAAMPTAVILRVSMLRVSMLRASMLRVSMLRVSILSQYAECQYAEGRYAESWYADFLITKCCCTLNSLHFADLLLNTQKNKINLKRNHFDLIRPVSLEKLSICYDLVIAKCQHQESCTNSS